MYVCLWGAVVRIKVVPSSCRARRWQRCVVRRTSWTPTKSRPRQQHRPRARRRAYCYCGWCPWAVATMRNAGPPTLMLRQRRLPRRWRSRCALSWLVHRQDQTLAIARRQLLLPEQEVLAIEGGGMLQEMDGLSSLGTMQQGVYIGRGGWPTCMEENSILVAWAVDGWENAL